MPTDVERHTTARISRKTMNRLKRIIRSDAEFVGPPRWLLADLLTRIVDEWATKREKVKR